MNINKDRGEAGDALCAEALQALLALSGIVVTLAEAGSVARALARLVPRNHGR